MVENVEKHPRPLFICRIHRHHYICDYFPPFLVFLSLYLMKIEYRFGPPLRSTLTVYTSKILGKKI